MFRTTSKESFFAMHLAANSVEDKFDLECLDMHTVCTGIMPRGYRSLPVVYEKIVAYYHEQWLEKVRCVDLVRNNSEEYEKFEAQLESARNHLMYYSMSGKEPFFPFNILNAAVASMDTNNAVTRKPVSNYMMQYPFALRELWRNIEWKDFLTNVAIVMEISPKDRIEMEDVQIQYSYLPKKKFPPKNMYSASDWLHIARWKNHVVKFYHSTQLPKRSRVNMKATFVNVYDKAHYFNRAKIMKG